MPAAIGPHAAGTFPGLPKIPIFWQEAGPAGITFEKTGSFLLTKAKWVL